ncbi:MAG: hypothetical protein OIF57_17760 [Marinobacterium sp.]|nr:hypothetical protein [Marinobacterium sp.]
MTVTLNRVSLTNALRVLRQALTAWLSAGKRKGGDRQHSRLRRKGRSATEPRNRAGRRQVSTEGWGVILWDEDGNDRHGKPGTHDAAVHIRIYIGTYL